MSLLKVDFKTNRHAMVIFLNRGAAFSPPIFLCEFYFCFRPRHGQIQKRFVFLGCMTWVFFPPSMLPGDHQDNIIYMFRIGDPNLLTFMAATSDCILAGGLSRPKIMTLISVGSLTFLATKTIAVDFMPCELRPLFPGDTSYYRFLKGRRGCFSMGEGGFTQNWVGSLRETLGNLRETWKTTGKKL